MDQPTDFTSFRRNRGTNRGNAERRQLRAQRELEQIQSLTDQQKYMNLARRCAGYRRRIDRAARTNHLNESNLYVPESIRPDNLDRSTLNVTGPRIIRQDNEVATVRQHGRLGPIPRDNITTVFEIGSTSAIAEMEMSHASGNEVATVRQNYRLGPIPRDNIPSVFEHGNTGTIGQTGTSHATDSNDVVQTSDTNFVPQQNTRNNAQRFTRPRRYHNLARGFYESMECVRFELPESKQYEFCNALLFDGETSQLCCRNGGTKMDMIPSLQSCNNYFLHKLMKEDTLGIT